MTTDLSAFGEVEQGFDVSDMLDRAMAATQKYGGGKIRIPNRQLRITRTIKLPSGVHLEGEGDHCTALSTWGEDFQALEISGENNGIHGLAIYGCMRGDASVECARINPGACRVIMSDSRIWGGSWGLATSGVDPKIDNCFIQGTGVDGGNVVSNGAGWYNHLQCDDGGQPHKYGFWQQWNGSSDPAENHFINSDFTGNFTEASILINDNNNNSNVTVFTGCVTNKRVLLYNAKWTGFVGHEFGDDVIKGNGHCSIGVSIGFGDGIRATGCSVGSECVGIQG